MHNNGLAWEPKVYFSISEMLPKIINNLLHELVDVAVVVVVAAAIVVVVVAVNKQWLSITQFTICDYYC